MPTATRGAHAASTCHTCSPDSISLTAWHRPKLASSLDLEEGDVLPLCRRTSDRHGDRQAKSAPFLGPAATAAPDDSSSLMRPPLEPTSMCSIPEAAWLNLRPDGEKRQGSRWPSGPTAEHNGIKDAAMYACSRSNTPGSACPWLSALQVKCATHMTSIRCWPFADIYLGLHGCSSVALFLVLPEQPAD